MHGTTCSVSYTRAGGGHWSKSGLREPAVSEEGWGTSKAVRGRAKRGDGAGRWRARAASVSPSSFPKAMESH